MRIEELNQKLATVFGLETKNLAHFHLTVKPNCMPVIEATYFLFEKDAPKILTKKFKMESMEDANP